MQIIDTSALPAPAGHYSRVVAQSGFVYLSGVLPSAAGTDPVKHDFRQQAQAVLRQCEQVLAAAGCTYADVVQATAYIVGSENWGVFNEVYAGFLGPHKPARTVVPVAELHYGYLVEVQLVAFNPRLAGAD
ncbi:RidA family protein [Janthinobacterium agaricidamnosum]|uniref:Endoribonuclease L-PSP family protein n=1 Tax=Janthinobacterium agaricidamnosum NBRC 102515 = DSM 9628 TaxID=1349767 RepID=W0V5K6_9BURK|nr:RidA family protein [Janthinobacterium agaricidamnosum]CDG82633.1 endoribonuclease L-PSP family protein [Janthinobacterium agaricidamnosum NBRC 102515 = DSM 9628]